MPGSYLDMQWIYVATQMPDSWYGSDEAKMAADSVLKYQTDIGGWAKNSGFHVGGVKPDEWFRIVNHGGGATFDNDATLTEMKFLAKIYAKTGDKRYRDSFIRAFNYTLLAQHQNGGWPQFFPYRKGKSAYSSHITYNDDLMVNVMRFLNDIVSDDLLYAPLKVNVEMKALAKRAYDKGLECILKTQIRVEGQPTVWCAQHNEFTLQPAGARSYELPSFSGGESVGVVLFLMEIQNPSPEVIKAVEGAVRWLDKHKIERIRIMDVKEDGSQVSSDSNIDAGPTADRIVVADKTAPPVWARFYDLETGKPFFCDRDGIKKSSLAEIGINRRSGYNWYTRDAAKVLAKYPEWKNKLRKN